MRVLQRPATPVTREFPRKTTTHFFFLVVPCGSTRSQKLLGCVVVFRRNSRVTGCSRSSDPDRRQDRRTIKKANRSIRRGTCGGAIAPICV